MLSRSKKNLSSMIRLALILALALPATSSAQRGSALTLTNFHAILGDSLAHSLVRRVVRATAIGGGIGVILGSFVGIVLGSAYQTNCCDQPPTPDRTGAHALRGGVIGLLIGSAMGYAYGRTHPPPQQPAKR
jgi:hypothetical protein